MVPGVRVAVTGSHGFIGSALVESLERDDHEVVRIARDQIGADALQGAEAVVHLAGEPIAARRWSPEQKRKILDSRTEITATLATALSTMDQRPRVLVSGSAIGYYGDRGDEVLRENSGPGDDFLADVCQAWEAATAAASDAGIRVAHIRTGLVLGKGGALAKMLPLFRFGLGGRFGAGRQWWSWIAMEDQIGAIRYVLDHDLDGPVNLTGPAPVTNVEFTHALGGVLHRPAVLPVPRFGPALVLGGELADQLLFSSQRVEPAVLADHGYRFRYGDVASALAAAVA
jgi:uncharacterized protein (TIGR01777 family)